MLQSNTDDDSFQSKQQNRDVEANISVIDPMDDYRPQQKPPIGGGAPSAVSPTGTIISDDIRSCSGKHIWSRNSSPLDYSSFSSRRGVTSLHKPGGAPGNVKRYSDILKEQQQQEQNGNDNDNNSSSRVIYEDDNVIIEEDNS